MDYLNSFFVKSNPVEEEEEEAKVEKRGRVSSMCLAIVFAVLILSTLVIGVIIIATVFYFAPALKETKFNEEYYRHSQQHSRHADVKLIYKRQNFSDAEDYCHNKLSDLTLFFPRGFYDEMRLTDFLSAEIENSSALINTLCGETIFIGVMRSLDKTWLLPNGEDAILPVTFNRNMSQRCTLMNFEKKNTVLQPTSCSGSQWKCVICEIPNCKNVSGCYKVFEDISASSFDEAAKYCLDLKEKQNLLSITHIKALPKIDKYVFPQIKGCKKFGIGNLLQMSFESVAHEPMTYQALGLEKVNRISEGLNCIGVNHRKKFRWELVNCSIEHCFICRDENLPLK